MPVSRDEDDCLLSSSVLLFVVNSPPLPFLSATWGRAGGEAASCADEVSRAVGLPLNRGSTPRRAAIVPAAATAAPVRPAKSAKEEFVWKDAVMGDVVDEETAEEGTEIGPCEEAFACKGLCAFAMKLFVSIALPLFSPGTAVGLCEVISVARLLAVVLTTVTVVFDKPVLSRGEPTWTPALVSDGCTCAPW